MLHAAFAIALKDLKLLLRDKTSAFFTFGFPLALAVFFGMVFRGATGDGEGSPILLAVVNESNGPVSESFIRDLNADEMIETTPAKDRAEGEQVVREGKALACVILPKGFDKGADSIFTGGGLEVEALVDPSRAAEAGLLTGKLNEIAFRQMGSIFRNPTQMKSMLDTSRAAIKFAPGLTDKDKALFQGFFDSAQRLTTESSDATDGDGSGAASGSGSGMGNFSPAKVTVTKLQPKGARGPSNSYSISFPQGIAWGLMGCVMSFAAGLAQERSRGTLLRLAVAPVTRRGVLLGKALGCFIACMAVIVLLMLFGRFFLDVEIANPSLFLLASAVAAFGFSGVMMFLTGIFRTEGGAEGAGRAVILVLAMIGGGTIPLAFMPKFLLTASMISPFRWAIFAVEGAIWRDLTIVQLLPAFGALILFGVVGFIVGGYGFAKAQAR